MTVELLTLIALWCGNPLIHDSYSIGPEVTIQDVNKCRWNLTTCVDKETAISFDLNTGRIIQGDFTKCFDQASYPGKDY